jgi:hypothetical protein
MPIGNWQVKLDVRAVQYPVGGIMIDSKLREILTPFASFGGGMDDYGSPGEAEIDEEVIEVIAQIHQAFADARYVTPENAVKVQEMVNQMVNLANDSFKLPTIQYIKPNKSTTKAKNLMTGQEFYNRFEKELEVIESKKGIDSDIHPDEFIEAAKKASGI